MTNSSLAPFSDHHKWSGLFGGPQIAMVGRAIDLLAGLFDFEVAEGYEDETGFHVAPVRASLSRPPSDGPIWLGENI